MRVRTRNRVRFLSHLASILLDCGTYTWMHLHYELLHVELFLLSIPTCYYLGEFDYLEYRNPILVSSL
jgi:hypothetical protein